MDVVSCVAIRGWWIDRGGTAGVGRDVNDFVQLAADERMRMVNIIDGTSKTFSIVEAKRAVPWRKPEDIEYAADKPVSKLGERVSGYFLAAMVDGSVHRVSSDIDEKALRVWITRNGREVGQELSRPKGP